MNIKLDNRTIEINKLPLGKYAALINALQELPKHFDTLKDFDKVSNDQLTTQIPKLLTECYPDVVRILEIATPLKKEEIEDLGLNEFIDIIIAIIEVNKFKDVYAKIKKAMAPQQQIQALKTE